MSKLNKDIELSVIIPVYNISKYVNTSIKTILEQSFKNLEYIFVDDHSTDNGLEMLKRLIDDRYSNLNIKIVQHEVNRGVSAARNTGLRVASGSYIGWADADDKLDKDLYSQLMQKAKQTDADIAWCDFYNVYSTHKTLVNQNINSYNNQYIESLLNGKMSGVLWNKIFRKQIFDDNKITFPDGLNVCEDLRVCVEFFYYSTKFSYVNKPLYYYIKHDKGSVSSNNSGSATINRSWIENVKGIEAFLVDKGIKDNDALKSAQLSSKKNILINARSVEDLKIWRSIFPSSNDYIYQKNYPIYYKLLVWSLTSQNICLTKLILTIKKILKNK